MSIRYVISGAQGFVGRYLIARLLHENEHIEVLGIGRSQCLNGLFTHPICWGQRSIQAPLPEPWPAYPEDRYCYLALDLFQRTELCQVLRDFRPHVVIHLASGLRDDPPEFLFRTNVEATIHLIEALAASGVSVRQLLLGSSGGVYGRPQEEELPLKEETPCQPIDLYAASKLAAEHTARILTTHYQIPTVWARLFNIVGAGQDERHVCGRFASQVAAMVQEVLPPVLEVGPLDMTRDFIDVRDVALALQLLATHGTPGEVYNVASGDESSIRWVLSTILRFAGLAETITIRQLPGRRADIVRHFADIQRLAAIGFQPQFTLQQSLEDLVRYYLDTVSKAASTAPA